MFDDGEDLQLGAGQGGRLQEVRSDDHMGPGPQQCRPCAARALSSRIWARVPITPRYAHRTSTRASFGGERDAARFEALRTAGKVGYGELLATERIRVEF